MENLINFLAKSKIEISLFGSPKLYVLLIALEFSMDIAADMITECNKNGLLVNAVRPNAIRFMPPLTVTESEIDQAIIKIKNANVKVTIICEVKV